ncbi:MAG: hypothetical protein ACTSU4_07070 [Promethearchaeota archaeon]
MRHYSKTHGKHCYLRSFKTSCRQCGADVLYWECTHGSKVFFEYPPYGKLIKHHCRFAPQKPSSTKYKVIVKRPKRLRLFEEEIFNCPICGKYFKHLHDLLNHLHELEHQDEFHGAFFKNELTILEPHEFKKEKPFSYKVKFGRINIKKKNSQKDRIEKF